MRLSEARKDHYRKLAKRQGYRSRSAYKLIQLDNIHHFLKPYPGVLVRYIADIQANEGV